MIPSGQGPSVRQVGDEKQTRQLSDTAERAATQAEGSYVDLMSFEREASKRMVLR